MTSKALKTSYPISKYRYVFSSCEGNDVKGAKATSKYGGVFSNYQVNNVKLLLNDVIKLFILIPNIFVFLP